MKIIKKNKSVSAKLKNGNNIPTIMYNLRQAIKDAKEIEVFNEPLNFDAGEGVMISYKDAELLLQKFESPFKSPIKYVGDHDCKRQLMKLYKEKFKDIHYFFWDKHSNDNADDAVVCFTYQPDGKTKPKEKWKVSHNFCPFCGVAYSELEND